ncbi:MAG: TAT-variant-translocated molybdopterin oxidoreductase [Microscillaceae bacterium]|nr:TAT-variant-translocated molybdopterin oxidoreductase [Microscillaceae bacterium]
MAEKRYWKGLEEYTNEESFVKNAEREFSEFAPEDFGENPNRRDFLKLMGFSLAAASLAACEAPVKKAIPYLNKPEDLDPTIPNFYASTYFEGGDYCSILVKTREGRPVKIEGNTLSLISMGGTSARAQASVLDLYDETRYRAFVRKDGKLPEEPEAIVKQNAAIDKEIMDKLASARNIRLVTPTIISPSTRQAIQDFIKKYPQAQHIQYDALSASSLLEANQESFGKAVLSTYDFGKAKVIVSIGADFLGTWLSPTEFSRQYARNRKVAKQKREMNRHYQFESVLTLTGANADYRTPIKPSQEALLVASLYKKVTGSDKFGDAKIEAMLEKAAKELKAQRGKSLVVSGSRDKSVQILVNAINEALGNYGNSLNLDTPTLTFQALDAPMNGFVEEVKAGQVDAVVFYGVNPVYHHPRGQELEKALSKVKTKISFAFQPDETAVLCDYVCPDNHYLESWGDAEPRQGHFSLIQPTITNIYNTRQAQESLLTWAGQAMPFYDYVRAYWQANLFPAQSEMSSFDDFWKLSLHNGVFQASGEAKPVSETPEEANQVEELVEDAPKGTFKADVNRALAEVAKRYKANSNDLELTVYTKISIGDGSRANNPWLQEMPDPISKACWGNYLAIPQSLAKEKNLRQDDVVKVSAKGFTFELPVLVQPGQAVGSVSVALGYGRKVAGKVGQGVGVNMFGVLKEGFLSGITLEATGKQDRIAQTQTHHTIMGRDIIQESILKEYQKDEYAGRHIHKIATYSGKRSPTDITLWKGHFYPNHSWGLVIDLNSCLGCGACTIACQAENNVPVVGKKEVLMSREMHWIRIDRYYSNPPEVQEKLASGEYDTTNRQLEEAADNPEVTFFPMMCQHCNNAPCETVCPVLATTHSSEGLNQMTYNRCIGTRYCANNCPYKVRRFNWFHYAEDTRFTEVNYHQTTDLGRMVLNPDVTVRSRGVMEKCTMCVQRIQAGKLEAKKEKRPVKDGEITTACASACPTEAIIFGDMRDLESNISKTLGIQKETIKGEAGAKDKTEYKITEPRAYHVLEEINVQPQIAYLTKIRNKDEGKGGHGKGHA